MRELLILRHAKSSWDDPSLDDHDRPLAPRGVRNATRMGEYLRDHAPAPDLVLCSSARRATETLERLSPQLATGGRVEIEPGLYDAADRDLLSRLHAVGDDAETVLLVGHNPGLGELAVLLAGSGDGLGEMREKYPTGALARLRFEGSWRDLRPGGAELVEFVVPRGLSDG